MLSAPTVQAPLVGPQPVPHPRNRYALPESAGIAVRPMVLPVGTT